VFKANSNSISGMSWGEQILQSVECLTNISDISSFN